MGKRGPAKTPTAILKMRDSRVLYDRSDNEPEPELGIPERPEMSDEAIPVWDRLVVDLEEMGVLSLVDWRVLQRYCELFIDWQKAQDFIRRNGTTYTITEPDPTAKSGQKIVRVAKFPQVNVRDSLSQQLLRIEQEFGLTPSARAGLEVNKVKHDEKSIERFLA